MEPETRQPEEVVEVAATPVIPPGFCQCGCGQKVRTEGSRYLRGHNTTVADAERIRATAWKPGETAPVHPSKVGSRKPITAAYRKILMNPFPGDPQGRTGAELLATSMFQQAVKEGNVMAAKEVTDRVEGKVKEVIGIEDGPDEETVHERLQLLADKLRNSGLVEGGRISLPAGTGEAGAATPGERPGVLLQGELVNGGAESST